ncbi:hypothetical protein Hypma_010826 [Hypsizygus marmoreus]|uniref:Uncharacterized protein n=1 Tax=Hypsizygus marmoreus TaxID=39966 RepID=A0A369JR35_HYPMA|nr:hypothetical protein Hypma_010826 [Hypsizygus marmoreus]
MATLRPAIFSNTSALMTTNTGQGHVASRTLCFAPAMSSRAMTKRGQYEERALDQGRILDNAIRECEAYVPDGLWWLSDDLEL